MASIVSTVTPIASAADCYHCGLPCPDDAVVADGHAFCCHGCRTVYGVLTDSGLARYYDLEERPGTRTQGDPGADRFAYLDEPSLKARLVDFDDGRTSRATLRLPQIHCASCVWLLENLDRLEPAVHDAEVDLLRREVSLSWGSDRLSLRGLVERLASIGYEPEITLDAGTNSRRLTDDPLVRRVGIAGFCFGNVMLFSLPEYLAGGGGLEQSWQRLFAVLNLALSVPVLLYAATPFLGGAVQALRRWGITIDVPIALGIVVLFGRSVVDIFSGVGPGYMDSFAGFVFFLLLGRLFQRHSFATLSFDRDYRSYFPLAVTVRDDDGDRPLPVADLQPGMRIIARHGELIPADSRLLSPHGTIDFSYVTGESEPVEAERGDVVWAGGRAAGPALELEVVREVSQGYLTRLWNREVFRDADDADLSTLTNRVARWFTLGVLVIAAATGLWWLRLDPATAAHAVTSVLIVACPCALALSLPFTTGTALNLLARAGLFLRDGSVVEALARTQAIVFDKTGTLTSTGDQQVLHDGETLDEPTRLALAAVLGQSVHPLSRAIRRSLTPTGEALPDVVDYEEHPGLGVAGRVGAQHVRLGSAAWLRRQGIDLPAVETGETAVHAAVDGRYAGVFRLGNLYRSGLADMLATLRDSWPLHLLSGDNERERGRLAPWFGGAQRLHFRQSPEAKLAFVQQLQREQRVLMVGDGLNDAGALKQSHVGLAVSDDIAAFSPACDGILQAERLAELPRLLRFSRACLWIVGASIGLSLLYNLTGLSFAVRGALSPLLSAVLMPVSSVSVIAFTVLATRLAARRAGLPR
jgi:Cu+-exporting ATPase